MLNSEIETIKIANSLKDVIETMVKDFQGFTPDGSKRLKCLCPLHQETVPSFKVYLDTDSWYCFGCKKGGDVFIFVQEINQVDYITACNILAERAGIPIPSWQGQAEQLAKGHREAQDLLGVITEYYHQALLTDNTIYNNLKTTRGWLSTPV